MSEEIRLVIPAKSEMLLVARMALAGFCSQLGADVDTLDDVRTLSDEACYCLMHQTHEAKAIIITAVVTENKATIRFEAKQDLKVISVEARHDMEIARGILGTLASDVKLQQNKEQMVTIEVSVHLKPV